MHSVAQLIASPDQKMVVLSAVSGTTNALVGISDLLTKKDVEDAKKAIDMFDRTNVPLLGVVENMAYLKTENGETVQLFPKGDLDAYLDAKKIKKLASVPFFPEVGISSEAGIPLMESHSLEDEPAQPFTELADLLIPKLRK